MDEKHDIKTIASRVTANLNDFGMHVIDKDNDLHKPWGGYLVIDDNNREAFLDHYFPKLKEEFPQLLQNELHAKILIVAPHSSLSWQYHLRRQELWKVVEGPIGVILSDTDELGELKTYPVGDLIRIKYLARHRLVGLENWGIIAEIWQHKDQNNPSDEEDIIRIADDYGRK